VHCYDVALDGGRRVVELATTTFLRHDAPLNEHPEVVDDVPDDPYSVSKAAAFRDGQRRVAEGQDIVFLIPGGTFGPSPCPNRAMSATSYNRLIRSALRGRVTEQISFPVPWVGVQDVSKATVGALDSGKAGDAYLAFGREDATTTAEFLNVALEVAGSEQRVADVRIAPGEEEAAISRYGETLVALAQRQFPVPWFDHSYTRQQLGYDPMSLHEAMEETVAWLRQIGQI
jgi:nucleoside-diphosphate-sugar epimerase